MNYPKPAILADIPASQHAVIEASAGTGKTYTIEHLVVELLLEREIELPQILVLTFTEKAAVELRRRIRAMLLNLSSGTKAPSPAGSTTWRLDAAGRGRLQQALRQFDQASIETIHAFFQRILTEHAFHTGRLFEQKLDDGRELFRRAFKTALRRFFAHDSHWQPYLDIWLESHNVDQLEDLLYNCHSKQRRFCPPFDAQELLDRLSTSPLIGCDQKSFDQLKAALRAARVHHSTAKSIVQRCERHAAWLSDRQGFSLPHWLAGDSSTPEDDFAYITDRLANVSLDGWAASLVQHIRDLAPRLTSFDSAMAQICVPAVQRLLAEEKQAYGAYDFDDMIGQVWAGLRGPHGSMLCASLRDRYRYALIDEFQDTDELQWQVFRRLFVESQGGNLINLIGDPKQAIFGFRGADVFTYLAARTEVQQVGQVVSLIENHRATSAMVEAVNCLFDQKDGTPFFNGPIRYDQPVGVGPQNPQGQDVDGSPVVPIHIWHCQPVANAISAEAFRRLCGQRIAREIQSLLDAKEPGLVWGQGNDLRRLQPHDIFVLTATNSEARAVGEYLRGARVPFAFFKQDGLFQTPEARDILHVLLAVIDPRSRGRRFQAWHTAFFAVPLEALPDCADLPASHPLMARLFGWHELANRRDIDTLCTRLVDDSGLARRELALSQGERELTNYLHILEILRQEARSTGIDLADLTLMLRGFIDGTRRPPGEDGDVQRLESDRAAVQIMTMHKSKGLEAPVVFLYGGLSSQSGRDGLYDFHENDQRWLYIGGNEAAKTKARRERVHEDQRLLYVALTRAKVRLYLPYLESVAWPTKWNGPYQVVNDRLPRLVSSAPPHLFHVSDLDRSPVPRPSYGPPAHPSSVPVPREYDDDLLFQQLRRARAGFELTSYSKLKRAEGGYVGPWEANDFDEGRGTSTPREDELPGGVASGQFLHGVLEEVPLIALAGRPPLALWAADPGTRAIFSRQAALYGIDSHYLPSCQAMIHRAFTTDMSLGPDTIPGLATAPQAAREVEFLYPFPERCHPRLTNALGQNWEVSRGFVRGFIDLIFSHGNRVYIVDWKSDTLPDYTPAALAGHVDANYAIQVKLYALALVKMLGIHAEADYEARFGGLLYCFLRGLNDGQGAHLTRPGWNDMLAYEQELSAASEVTP
jgi:exodeoxyribonuclease V beta subunit